MITIPHTFLTSTDTKKILVDGLNCVIYKSAHQENPDNQRYLATFAFTYVISGALRVACNNQIIFVEPGQMISLPKGIYMISDIIPETKAFNAVVFFLEQDLIEDFIEDKTSKNLANEITPIVLSKNERVGQFVNNLIDLYADRNDNRVTKPKLTELLHLLVTSQLGQDFLQQFNAIKNQEKVLIKPFMEKNFDKPLKIEDYANLTGRSISTFHRDFKRLFNKAPKQWLIDKRLEKARYDLEVNTNTSVTSVAFSSGYESASHFIKAFQNKYEISPKQLMMQSRKQIKV